MKTLNIFRAQPSYKDDDDRTPPVSIVIDTVIPELGRNMPTPEFWKEAHHRFDKEAQMVHEGLKSLPGGTYDRLLGLMLANKATHFNVAHDPFPSTKETM